MTSRPVLGIDLGTTYTCVAHLDENQRASVLPNQEGDLTTPSVVYLENDGTVTVGKFAKNEVNRDRDHVIDLVKRHMGESDYTIPVDDKQYYPQQVSAMVLRSVVEDAISALGLVPSESGPIADAVITVPAYFGSDERQATSDAGQMAGLNVINVINEPTAAAIAYGLLRSGEMRTVLVYDLGGGTFDVTVIKVSDTEIRVVATGGDHALGGADWDERIVAHLVERFDEMYPDAGGLLTDEDAVNALPLIAERMKMALSRRDKYPETITAHGERAAIEVTRAEFEGLTADLVERTLGYVDRVRQEAAAKGVTAIDDVVLVGGMSKLPSVAQALAQRFPDLPAGRLTDPDQIVAKGAALYAASRVAETADGNGQGQDQSSEPVVGQGRWLGGEIDLPKIINVTSKGYGVQIFRNQQDKIGYLTWLIQPNDEVPVAPMEDLKTLFDNQISVALAVYESTTDQLTDQVSDHKLLVEGKLQGLPPGQPAGQPIQVFFTLGEDGILRILGRAAHGAELTMETRATLVTPPEVLAEPLPLLTR